MTTLFRQPTSVLCFYCQSTIIPIPRNPRSFKCPHCDCHNQYDKNGEIMSDEPAMHDENLNARSFAKRASPRKDRLPSMYGNTHFCHTCQTNQMLMTHLLSNYLPPPDDPEYESLLEGLPEYQRSIELRYPPVCSDCMPSVEEEIRKRDNMARVRALGSALRDTKGTDNRRRTSTTQKEKDKLERELRMWKVRGCLWAGSMVCTLAGYTCVAVSYYPLSLPSFFPLTLLVVVVISILWTAWDPTYATWRRYQFQGRVVRVQGKRTWSSLQLAAWSMRLSTAAVLVSARLGPKIDFVHLWDSPRALPARLYASTMLACEFILLVWSVLVIKVHHPPPVRLVDSKGHLRQLSQTPSVSSSRSGTPAVPEQDLFSTLTLSNNPIFTAAPTPNPIFGMPSFSQSGAPSSPSRRPNIITPRSPDMDIDMDEDRQQDSDAMEVDSISPVKKTGRNDDGSWLHPQRFFAPEEPTGLENLFARTIRLADIPEQNGNAGRGSDGHVQGSRRRASGLFSDWRTWTALCIVPLLAVGYKTWDVYQRSIVGPQL